MFTNIEDVTRIWSKRLPRGVDINPRLASECGYANLSRIYPYQFTAAAFGGKNGIY